MDLINIWLQVSAIILYIQELLQCKESLAYKLFSNVKKLLWLSTVTIK